MLVRAEGGTICVPGVLVLACIYYVERDLALVFDHEIFVDIANGLPLSSLLRHSNKKLTNVVTQPSPGPC